MNRVINITGKQIKKVSASNNITTLRKTTQPSIQTYRHQSTTTTTTTTPPDSKQPKPIISKEFLPRRRTPSNYKPATSRQSKPLPKLDPAFDFTEDFGVTILGDAKAKNEYEQMWYPNEKYVTVSKFEDEEGDCELTKRYNPHVAAALKHYQRLKERGEHPLTTPSIDSQLRAVDWLTAEQGSTEDAIMRRRAFADGAWNEKEREKMKQDMDQMAEELREMQFDLEDKDVKITTPPPEEGEDGVEEDQEEDEKSLVAGCPWRDMIVDISRVQKVTRSGTIVTYRALVVGGNARGVAGFGVGKGSEPDVATASAKRHCHRNIFFLEAYQGSGITHDLVGKHNNCKVVIRAVSQGYGIHGNQLIQDILLAFGVTNATAKAYGRRNKYSVVYATFKAIMTHKSLESVSLARGKKFLTLDRARRLEYK